MVVGFNHNFRYKGAVYHIQTEDSGLRSPNIVTLLYQGGTILASKKTSYADITKIDNLAQVVEELMKEQHKEMLRSLKAGEFDAVIEGFRSRRQGGMGATAGERSAASMVATPTEKAPQGPIRSATPPTAADAAPRPSAQLPPTAAAPGKAGQPVASAAKSLSPADKQSLDDMILSYLFPEVDEN